MSPEILNEVFKARDTPYHNLRHTSQFSTDPIHSVYNRSESTSHLVPKIWEQILAKIRNKKPLHGLKREIKKMNPVE